MHMSNADDSTKEGYMPYKLGRLVKRIILSIALSMGILSIANIDHIWRQNSAHEDLASLRAEAKRRWMSRLAGVAQGPALNGMALDLHNAMALDELNQSNPYLAIASLDPLEKIFQLGVARFDRQALRSSRFMQESGYDLVVYTVQHVGQAESTVVGYLEYPLESGGAPSVVVVLLTAASDGGRVRHQYRNGILELETPISDEDSRILLAQHLQSAIPFFSARK